MQWCGGAVCGAVVQWCSVWCSAVQWCSVWCSAVVQCVQYSGAVVPVVQWCSGAVVQWCSGAVQWCGGAFGALGRWCSGAGQWCSGAVQWCGGAVGRLCSGAVQWCHGAVVQCRAVWCSAVPLLGHCTPQALSTPVVFLGAIGIPRNSSGIPFPGIPSGNSLAHLCFAGGMEGLSSNTNS